MARIKIPGNRRRATLAVRGKTLGNLGARAPSLLSGARLFLLTKIPSHIYSNPVLIMIRKGNGAGLIKERIKLRISDEQRRQKVRGKIYPNWLFKTLVISFSCYLSNEVLMLKSISIIPFSLGIIIIASIVICKYFHSPGIFLLIVILASIFYQIDTNKKDNKKYNFDETLINVAKFIMVTGILGYIIITIIGLFSSSFN